MSVGLKYFNLKRALDDCAVLGSGVQVQRESRSGRLWLCGSVSVAADATQRFCQTAPLLMCHLRPTRLLLHLKDVNSASLTGGLRQNKSKHRQKEIAAQSLWPEGRSTSCQKYRLSGPFHFLRHAGRIIACHISRSLEINGWSLFCDLSHSFIHPRYMPAEVPGVCVCVYCLFYDDIIFGLDHYLTSLTNLPPHLCSFNPAPPSA